MKKTIKRIVSLGICLIILGIILIYKDKIYRYVDEYFHPYNYIVLDEVNEYYRDYDFLFVQNTDNFVPENIQDLYNIYYTVINSGKSNFTFYCTEKYPSCINDIQAIANDQNILSDINNYVHPYNGFAHIETEYDSLGRVSIHIMHNYSVDEINLINTKFDDLATKLINPNRSNRENIIEIHNYIVNNTKYDSVMEDTGESIYNSHSMYGILYEGYGVCSAYTDLMQLFLEKMNIKNYRVSSDEHVWNALYLDGEWLHLDVTWDDPVVKSGDQIIDRLDDKYLLVSTKDLLNKGHVGFDYNHFIELKEV